MVPRMMNHPIDTRISPIWKVCLDETWEALCSGSVPAGAAWVDTDNTIIRGPQPARDREACALQWLSCSPYMLNKNVRAEGSDPFIKSISLALMTVHLLKRGTKRGREFIESFQKDNPRAEAPGRSWQSTGFIERAMERREPVDVVIEAALTTGEN